MKSSRALLALTLLGSGFAGVLVAVQSRVNGGFALELGSGYVAAAVASATGTLALCVALVFSGRARSGLRSFRATVLAGRFPLWMLIGCLGGAALVLAQGTVAPVLGLALFTVGIVAGQVFGGLLLDLLGLGPGGRIAATPARITGTGLAVVAVCVSVWTNVGEGRILLVILPMLVGMLLAAQSTVNGLVRVVAESAITATFINFLLGTAALSAVAIVHVAFNGWPRVWPENPLLYTGGVIGVLFVAISSVLVRRAGVLLLSMSNVAGQLFAALALEAGLPLAEGLTPWMIAGAVIALAAVIIAALPGGSRSATRSRSRLRPS